MGAGNVPLHDETSADQCPTCGMRAPLTVRDIMRSPRILGYVALHMGGAVLLGLLLAWAISTLL